MGLVAIPEIGMSEIGGAIEIGKGQGSVYVAIDEGPGHLTHLCIVGFPKKATPG